MKKADIKNSADMFFYKAMVDFNSGKYLLKSFENDELEIDIEKIYFDFQQSAEKLFKALLTHHQIDTEKTHDISKLIKICKSNDIILQENIEILIDLTEYAVEGRYGIICDDLNDTQNYIDTLDIFIQKIEKKLKIKHPSK